MKSCSALLWSLALSVVLVNECRGASPDPADSTASGRRAGVVTRAGRLVQNFASDAWYVASSPARIHRAGWVRPIAIFGTAAILYAYDEEITRGFHRSHENRAYEAVVEVGEAVEGIGYPGRSFPYYIGGTLIGAAFRIEPVQQAGLEIMESQFISGGIRNAATYLIGRRREHEGRGARFLELDGGTSFPSGHTSTAFQLATILSHHIDRAPVTALLYAVAGTVCIQRVESRSHWPSDVWLSAVEGTLVARVVIRRNRERRDKEPSVLFMADGRGVGVRVRF